MALLAFNSSPAVYQPQIISELYHPQSIYCEQIAKPGLELAKRLTENANGPQEAIQTVFDGVMQAIEKRFNIKITQPVRDRVWVRVAEAPLTILFHEYQYQVATKVLGRFNAKTIQSMLEEHKSRGSIRGRRNALESIWYKNKDLVRKAVVTKASSMADSLAVAVFSNLWNEGAFSQLSESTRADISNRLREVVWEGRCFRGKEDISWSDTTRKIVGIAAIALITTAGIVRCFFK